jgi:bifunctional DNA-binding transcriptional regulator/antitoxin component of YhaV-PrlF toxin-antitoxin module
MKSTGMVRKIDELGRSVVPIEMRRTLDIAERDPMEIFVEGGAIVLKKYVPEKARAKRYICAVCAKEISEEEIESHAAQPYRVARVKREA